MGTGRVVLLGIVLTLQLFDYTSVAKADGTRDVAVLACNAGQSRRVALRSTDRLPEASGSALVERKGGTTEIEVDVNSMKPAALFGGDYNTYVLWVVPPDGAAINIGEVTLNGSRGKASASTPESEFAILVTAEPHYLVSAPSAFVLLESKPELQGRTVRQPLIEGVYNFNRSSLSDVKAAKGTVDTEVRQAFTAVRLAHRAGAETLVPVEFGEAQRALEQTLALSRDQKDKIEIAAQARETVRLAVAAQHLARDRALQATRVGEEGSGGGKGETGGHDLRGSR
jgi:hypothetical protein